MDTKPRRGPAANGPPHPQEEVEAADGRPLLLIVDGRPEARATERGGADPVGAEQGRVDPGGTERREAGAVGVEGGLAARLAAELSQTLRDEAAERAGPPASSREPDGGAQSSARSSSVAAWRVRRSTAAALLRGTAQGPPDGAELQGAAVVLVPCRRHPDVESARRVAAVAVRKGAAALVVVASTEIYEPSPRSPGLIDESRLAPAALGHPVARGWWCLEEAVLQGVEEGRATGLERDDAAPGRDAPILPVILRAAPVPLVRADACGGDDWVSDLFAGPWATTVAGFDPTLQLLAPSDLAAAVLAALGGLEAQEDPRRGEPRPSAAEAPGRAPAVFNVVPAEVVPLSWALRLAGVGKLPLPGSLAPGAGAEENRGTGAAEGRSMPASRRAYLRHPWTASGGEARRVLGFEARFGSADVAASFSRTGQGETGRDGPPPIRRVPLSFDDFGFSPRYVAGFDRTLFRFLHDAWWRVEVRGIETVPAMGPVVLVGVHRGFMPWDGVMALHVLRREVGRTPRFLVHPSLLKFPFLANYMRRLGGVLACEENARHVLGRGGMLGVFPEGIRGAFLPYRRAHRLSRWFRRDYVRFAIAHGAPIVPFATVGSAEIYPILGRLDWRWWKRLTEWPYLPLTPTFPLLPVPLPTQWHTEFLAPLEMAERHPPEAAEDPAVVRRVGEEVEARLQAAMDEMRRRRRSWWRGRIWKDG